MSAQTGWMLIVLGVAVTVLGATMVCASVARFPQNPQNPARLTRAQRPRTKQGRPRPGLPGALACVARGRSHHRGAGGDRQPDRTGGPVGGSAGDTGVPGRRHRGPPRRRPARRLPATAPRPPVTTCAGVGPMTDEHEQHGSAPLPDAADGDSHRMPGREVALRAAATPARRRRAEVAPARRRIVADAVIVVGRATHERTRDAARWVARNTVLYLGTSAVGPGRRARRTPRSCSATSR